MSAKVDTVLISLWIVILSDQLRPETSQYILLFLSLILTLAPKYLLQQDTEPVFFVNSIIAENARSFYT